MDEGYLLQTILLKHHRENSKGFRMPFHFTTILLLTEVCTLKLLLTKTTLCQAAVGFYEENCMQPTIAYENYKLLIISFYEVFNQGALP